MIHSTRYAAIVLSQLPPREAARLLSRLDPRQLRAVSAKLDADDPPDPRETRAALRRFLAAHRGTGPDRAAESSTPSTPAPPGDFREPVPRTPPPKHATMPALEFLRGVEPGRLHELLRHEHPQTMALVLAALPPARAAVLLQRFPAELQALLMRRVGYLQPLDAETARRFEEALAERLRHLGPTHGE